MSNPKISVATLAPPPAAPAAPRGPALPSAPAHLHQGASGLGPLPGPSIMLSTLPHRYMLAGVIPLAVAAALTLLALVISWPVPGLQPQPQLSAPVNGQQRPLAPARRVP